MVPLAGTDAQNLALLTLSELIADLKNSSNSDGSPLYQILFLMQLLLKLINSVKLTGISVLFFITLITLSPLSYTKFIWNKTVLAAIYVWSLRSSGSYLSSFQL